MANDKPVLKNVSQVKRNGVVFQEYTNSKGNIVREAFDNKGNRLAKGIMDSKGANFSVKPIRNEDITHGKSSYAVNTLSMERGLFVPKSKTVSKPAAKKTTAPKQMDTRVYMSPYEFFGKKNNNVDKLEPRKAGLVDNINVSNLDIKKSSVTTPAKKVVSNNSKNNIKSIKKDIKSVRKENRLENKIDRTQKKEVRLTEKLNKLKGTTPQARKGGLVKKIVSKKNTAIKLVKRKK